MTPPRIVASELADWIRSRSVGVDRYLFGLAGAPGSGKSTLARDLGTELDAAVVPMDGFHLPNAVLDQRGLRAEKGAPRTFDADAFVAAVRRLRAGPTGADAGDVRLPDFDRIVDEPRADRIVVAATAQIVVVEGNYLLLDEPPWVELRDLFDAIGHIEIDDATRVERLIRRHVEFGKTPHAAAEFVDASDEPNAHLVNRVRARAGLVIEADR